MGGFSEAWEDKSKLFAMRFKGTPPCEGGGVGGLLPPSPGYPLLGCTPAEPNAVSPDSVQYKRMNAVRYQCTSSADPVWMVCHNNPSGDARDATEDYPQSDHRLQVVCVRPSDLARRRVAAGDRSGGPCASQWPPHLLWLRPAGADVRSFAAATAIRVCAAVGHAGALCVSHATGELRELRREGRKAAVGARQMPDDDRIPMVPGSLGPADELEGGRRSVSRELGPGVRSGKTSRFVGFDASGPLRHRVHRRGRSAMASGPRVSNGRVPTRRGLQAIVVDRSRPDGQDAAAPASAGWGENEPRRSNSSAATCGGRT